jgi:hypothetical protein
MCWTVLPNIWINRRYESQANRGLSACAASPCTLASFSPIFRTVSIIPGIENFAPDRTDTSSGSAGSPSFFPRAASRAVRCSATSASKPAGTDPDSKYARHASVEIVNPGGTGRPILTISARLAPLPPSRSFWSLPPSEKSKTNLCRAPVDRGSGGWRVDDPVTAGPHLGSSTTAG